MRRTSSGRVPRPPFGFVAIHSRGAPVERSWRGRGYTRDRSIAQRGSRSGARRCCPCLPLPCTARRRSAASEARAATKALLMACGGIGRASDAEKLCSRWRVRILYRTRALAENVLSKRTPVIEPVRGARPLRVSAGGEQSYSQTACASRRSLLARRALYCLKRCLATLSTSSWPARAT